MHLKVPFGHGFGTEVPTEQKKPRGHGNPVRLSRGIDSEAPPTQTNPAAHGPLGKVLPYIKHIIQAKFLVPPAVSGIHHQMYTAAVCQIDI